MYLDLSFFDHMEQQYGAGGAFAQAYVIAHELGHHVQTVLGTSGQISQLQSRNPAAANKLSVLTELQADCYAGVWAHSTYKRGLIGPDEIARGLRHQVHEIFLGLLVTQSGNFIFIDTDLVLFRLPDADCAGDP